MSSQETLSQNSPPALAAPEIPVPGTPVPQHASLSEPAAALASTGALPNLQSSRIERSKYSSPPPPPSSMTPPPSCQLPQLAPSPLQHDNRATTPPTSHLSSPPATIKPALALTTIGSSGTEPIMDDIANASAAELRSLVTELSVELKGARTSAAHEKLQHNLLSIETSEAAQRMEVEHEMTRREVEVLMAEKNRRSVASSPYQHQPDAHSSPAGRLANELKTHGEALQRENELLQRRLRKAKKMITQRDSEVAALSEDNERLRKRIKDNREHLNQLRSPGGIYQNLTPRVESLTPRTPRQQGSARSANVGSARTGGRGDPFAALILADQVLSQESASVPSTPTRNRPAKQHLGHHRGAHSLSSLPSTPQNSRPVTANSALLPSANIPPLNTRFARTAPSTKQSHEVHHSRRASRDSTISASDIGDDVQQSSSSEELPDSQASQLASRMLKVAPEEKVEVVGTPPPTGSSSKLLQSKLFGNVQKGGVERLEKRKRGAEDVQKVAVGKKTKTGSGVGLGIGGWMGSRA
ncbi:MAG: hypothetical protein M1812_003266 [Candelaria pacifica]|nr:MAG: hypothetical protein M1812_003266 [Candelaria pacifica]